MLQTHTFEPVFNCNSIILILGTFPSVKSKENKFYYGHPQNRFWQVISNVYDCEKPQTVEEKIEFLLLHGTALWDVIKSCEIIGSADNKIRNIIQNDISVILSRCNIRQIYANGKMAEKLYNQYILPTIGHNINGLPSTSPANAAWSVKRLSVEWSCINNQFNIL